MWGVFYSVCVGKHKGDLIAVRADLVFDAQAGTVHYVHCRSRIGDTVVFFSSYSFQLPGLTALGGAEEVVQAGQLQVK